MEITKVFKEIYGKSPSVAAQAPGRLEILGNHTDYNEGLVLSAAVTHSAKFALAPIDGEICYLRSHPDFGGVEFNLNEIDEAVPGDWSNYVKGLIIELRKRNVEIGAFEALLTSDVPVSAGMSSSAAIEMAAGLAFANAFGINFPKTDWARIGQGVENSYLGVQSGLLDQFSSLYGEKNSLIFCDFREVAVKRTVSLPEGYVLVVVNSMIKHDLVDSDYNLRRESCERAVEGLKSEFPNIQALRDVSPEMLETGKSLIAHQDYLRAKHVVGENSRVIKGIEALDAGDINVFGELLFESHQSSRENFDNSCPELDYLVELAQSIPGCLGARLSGGGFGGISIHLVETNEAQRYCDRIQTAFQLRTNISSEPIICAIGDGAAILEI